MWHQSAFLPLGRGGGDVAEHALARARAAIDAADSAEVGTPPRGRARSSGRRHAQPACAKSPSRLSAVADALGQQHCTATPVGQQHYTVTPVALIDSIRATQMELSALRDGNASWTATAKMLQQEPSFVTEPAVEALLGRQYSLQMQLDSTAAWFATPGLATMSVANTSLAASDGTQVTSTKELGTRADTGSRELGHAEPKSEPLGRAGRSQVAATSGVAPSGMSGTAALRRWQRWLSHLQYRVRARLLRSVVHSWRACAATQSARREGILKVVEQHRSLSVAAAKRQTLQRWHAAEEQQALRRRHRAAVVERRRCRASTRLAVVVVRSWRQTASRGVLQRRLSLLQAMHSAAEESGAAERSMRIAAEAELQKLRGQLAESQRELAVHLTTERGRSEALQERVQLLEAAAETFKERQEQGAMVLREALAARQDAVLEKSAALARAASSREAELARGAELKAAKRALLAATRTLEACEKHGLVRRAPSGAIEVCEIPVTTAPPEPSNCGKAPPNGRLPKAAHPVMGGVSAGDDYGRGTGLF